MRLREALPEVSGRCGTRPRLLPSPVASGSLSMTDRRPSCLVTRVKVAWFCGVCCVEYFSGSLASSMIPLLFWNVGRPSRHALIARRARANDADVILLAEVADEPIELLKELNRTQASYFFSPGIGNTKILAFTRFSDQFFRPSSETDRLTIRRLAYRVSRKSCSLSCISRASSTGAREVRRWNARNSQHRFEKKRRGQGTRGPSSSAT